MIGLGTSVDDLAAAVSQLLVVSPRQVEPLVDPAVALGSRNAVSAEVRTLIGAVTETPLRPARDVTAQDMADHPARSSCRRAIRDIGRTAATTTAP
jgi:hypothetical protein